MPEISETSTIIATHTIQGAYPEKAIGILCDAGNITLGQPIIHSKMLLVSRNPLLREKGKGYAIENYYPEN